MALAFLTIGRRRRGRRRCDIIFVPISGRSARRVRLVHSVHISAISGSRSARRPVQSVQSPAPSVRPFVFVNGVEASIPTIYSCPVCLSVCLKRRDGPSRLEADCCCRRILRRSAEHRPISINQGAHDLFLLRSICARPRAPLFRLPDKLPSPSCRDSGAPLPRIPMPSLYAVRALRYAS